jgi:anti-sigma regulatory factor (Ser/Thr protein kinase)
MRWFRIAGPSTAAAARSAAAALARRLGFPAARADELVLAVSEAASNLDKHARDGSLLLQACFDDNVAGIEFVTIDAGPGVADVKAAARDGHSTTGTLGVGLGAIRRLADYAELFSVLGRGTALVARFWPVPRTTVTRCAGLIRPISGETESGDAFAALFAGDMITGVLCDGLGHGPLAALAAREALGAVLEDPQGDPAALLRRVHQRISATRGGAVAVAQAEGNVLRFAGLGNVAAWILTADTRSGLTSVPGIAGHRARTIRQFEYPLPPGAAVVLHSDGLSSRWDLRHLPGLAALDPLVIAAALLAEAGAHRDDAGILVLKS